MKQVVFIIFLLVSTLGTNAQTKEYTGIPSLVWPKLIDITYKAGQDQYGEIQIPVFSEKVKNMEGKVVTLPGYMIPFEGGYKETRFILSSLPINACFFCGTGGPESVIEIKSKKAIAYSEMPIEVRGILRINNSDPDQMIYALEEVEYLGTVKF